MSDGSIKKHEGEMNKNNEKYQAMADWAHLHHSVHVSWLI
jgi:hypothetical protein